MPEINNINFRKIKIETENLILNEISLNHRKRFFEIFSDKEVLKYTDRKFCSCIDEAVLFLKQCNKRAGEKEHIFLGIFLKSNHDLAGVLGVYHLDIKHSFASLGILLAKEYWRMGYMSEALKSFLHFYFMRLKFNRLELQTYVNNVPAISFFEKLQFKKEGRLRQNFLISGNYKDSFIYSMLCSDFECLYLK